MKNNENQSKRLDKIVGNDIGTVVAPKRTKSQLWAAEYGHNELPGWVQADLAKSGLNSATIKEMAVFAANGNKADLLKEMLGFACLDSQSISGATDFFCLPYLQSEGYVRCKLEIAMDDAKYLSPSKATYDLWHMYFLPAEAAKFKKTMVPVVCTEGEKKTAKLTQELRDRQLDLLAVGFPGVTMWEHCVEWQYLHVAGRTVYIAFDSDFATKRPVQLEIAKLALWLYSKKANPRLLSWPREAKGIDDYLVAGGDLVSIVETANNTQLGELFAALNLVSIEDIATYCARYHYRKAAVKTLYETCNFKTLYKATKSTIVELYTRAIRAEEAASAAEAEQDAHPLIPVTPGMLPQTVDEAELALVTAGTGIYQRGGMLVKSVKQIGTPSGGMTRQKEGIVIVPVTATALREILTRIAHWERVDFVNGNAAIDCPDDVAETLLARGEWRLPVLTRVIAAPTLRQDGSLLETPGYDEATGLYFHSSDEKFPSVYLEAGYDEARMAVRAFEELLQGFPFVDDASFAVALSAILTALVRPSLRTAPLFCFTAPKMGSGKSLLADVVAMIATGNPAVVVSQGDGPEEEKKRLLAILIEGDQVVCVDNVERPLGGDALCSILTQERWKDRILGSTKTVAVDTKTTWLATGNNLVIQGDLATRTLICTLDPQMERPENRRFTVNLYEHVPTQRGSLVKAALTILKAFYNAGRPTQPIAQFGRFEAWSDLVRSSLVWLGLADPCDSRKIVEDKDPTTTNLRILFHAWIRTFQSKPQTLNAAITAANVKKISDSSLYDAMYEVAGERDTINVRRLGKFFKSYENRIESIPVPDGIDTTIDTPHQLKNFGKDHTQKTLWAVEAVTNKSNGIDTTIEVPRQSKNSVKDYIQKTLWTMETKVESPPEK